MSKIEPREIGDRGIRTYGDDVVCTYGTTISVSDSSSAERVAAWLRLSQGGNLSPADAAAHLTVDQAKAVIAKLQAWVDCAERDETPFGGFSDD